jgi:hypothetical protein
MLKATIWHCSSSLNYREDGDKVWEELEKKEGREKTEEYLRIWGIIEKDCRQFSKEVLMSYFDFEKE